MERLRESDYAERLSETVRPYLETRRVNGYFRATGDAPCFYSVFYPEAEVPFRGTAVLVHGFTESIEKHAEMIWYYLQNGYRVCIYEQRGHGRSFHDNGKIHVTDIDRFDRYADDLQIFTEKVVSRCPGPYVLHAHSMGGGVSALYLERGGTFFRKAVLNSPLFAPNTYGLPVGLCRGLFGFFKGIGLGGRRIVTEGDYPGREEFETSCTSSPNRFYGYEMMKRRTPYFQNYCATNRWAYESLGLKRKLLGKGGPEAIAIPVLVVSAELDRVVQVPIQKAFADRLKQGSYLLVPDVKHEIYLSPDANLYPYLDRVFSFLNGED
ncbi:MAG: alpha/beta hydrolase, partial [Clostridia bacterium]|nr:alpha/beta hydrolase [Clostridia bacterium]